MLTFSDDPDLAEQQMNAIIFYLTAFGYIDGNFDFTEKTFVRIYIRQLVTQRAQTAMPNADDKTRDEVVNKFTQHFHEVFEQTDHSVRELFDEAVADGEDVEKFVYAKLKLRSYEIFQSFDKENQQELLATVDELIYADGSAHPSEKKFREEIEADFIRMKLAELGWNISKTAQVLGIERTNLHKKLRALGIHRGEDGKDE